MMKIVSNCINPEKNFKPHRHIAFRTQSFYKALAATHSLKLRFRAKCNYVPSIAMEKLCPYVVKLKFKRALFALLLALFTLPVLAQDAKYRKIDSLLNYFYQNDKFMGGLTIREKGEVVFSKAYGFADADAKLPAKPNTKYKIGSLTKMFTSTIIFQLVEEKKLKLDTRLSEFYPKIKNADKITILEMLGHKSGLFNYTDDPEFDAASQKLIAKRDMLLKLEAAQPVFEPGSRIEYSNTNYLLLGYIIQDITKKPYKENVTSRITTKLGMKDTYYYGKINPKKNEARSYTFDGTDWIKAPEWHESHTGAAGGFQSTGEDMTKFIKALFDRKLIKKESLDIMLDTEEGFGKGIFAFPFGERRFYGHTGGIESFESVLGYYPKDDFGFALLINGSNYQYNDIIIGILSCYYKLPYIFPDLTSIKLDDTVLKQFEGIYSTPELPYKVHMTVKNGTLIAHAEEQGSFPLNPVGENEFNFVPAGITITFTDKGFTLVQSDGSTTEFVRD